MIMRIGPVRNDDITVPAALRSTRRRADVEPTKATDPIEAATSGRPAAEPTTPDGVTVPDQSWTVVQLRAEARARGLAGLSNKSKTQLIAALS